MFQGTRVEGSKKLDQNKLEPKKWYWVRKSNGVIVPYRLNRLVQLPDGTAAVEMFVGSMVQTFLASQIVGPAENYLQGDNEDEDRN